MLKSSTPRELECLVRKWLAFTDRLTARPKSSTARALDTSKKESDQAGLLWNVDTQARAARDELDNAFGTLGPLKVG